MGGVVDDIGPAFSGKPSSTPFTFGDLYALAKLFGIVLACVTTVGGIIWWAATLHGNVDTLKSDVKTLDKETRSFESHFARHDVQIEQIEGNLANVRRTIDATAMRPGPTTEQPLMPKGQ